LTYFSRGVRAVTTSGQAGDAVVPLAVLTVVALVTFVAGAVALPRTD
jgi:hypothetical protein